MEREAAGDEPDATAVVRQLVEWFGLAPFEEVRGTFLTSADFDSAFERMKVLGFEIPDVIDPEVEIPSEGVAGVRDEAGFRGKDGWMRFWATWFEPWADYEWTPENWQQVGGCVVIDAFNKARGRESGAPVEWWNTQVWTVSDGRVVRLVGYQTREEAMASLAAD
jgi:hypothetical protein